MARRSAGDWPQVAQKAIAPWASIRYAAAASPP